MFNKQSILLILLFGLLLYLQNDKHIFIGGNVNLPIKINRKKPEVTYESSWIVSKESIGVGSGDLNKDFPSDKFDELTKLGETVEVKFKLPNSEETSELLPVFQSKTNIKISGIKFILGKNYVLNNVDKKIYEVEEHIHNDVMDDSIKGTASEFNDVKKKADNDSQNIDDQKSEAKRIAKEYEIKQKKARSKAIEEKKNCSSKESILNELQEKINVCKGKPLLGGYSNKSTFSFI